MMNKRPWPRMLGVLGLSLCAFSASAEFYAGALVSYANAEFHLSSSSSIIDSNPYLLQAQGGYFFNDYLALEARYGTGIERDSGLSIDSLASGFVRLNVPVSERVAMYGLAGYSSIQVDQKNADSDSDQGFSFGLGVHYALDKHNAVVFEYINNISEDQIRLNTMTLGFQHRF